jgi:hypothetical protein
MAAMPFAQLYMSLLVFAADQPGKGNNPSMGTNIGIIILIAALFVLGVLGWFRWQGRH